MILRNCDMRTFSQRCAGKRIICYGIGGEFIRIMRSYEEYEWTKNICMLVDGDLDKRGTVACVHGEYMSISSLDDLKKNIQSNMVLLITSMSYYEIVLKLNTIDILSDTECYLFHFMFHLSEDQCYHIKQVDEKIIPPKIHYCWFGGSPLPDEYKRNIESWSRYCPNYEIYEWNESNCDIYETVYTRQAYELGKYGFVPDYFRLKIIYEQGGIYLDTDVEVLKNLDDLRYNYAFCGLEFPGEVGLGLGFGAVKKNQCIKKLLKRYRKMQFLKNDGSLNEIASPVYQSEDLVRMGLNYKNELQVVGGMTIYPIEVLSPQNVYTGITSISTNTYMWHHFDGSWMSGERLKRKKMQLRHSLEIFDLITKDSRKM